MNNFDEHYMTFELKTSQGRPLKVQIKVTEVYLQGFRGKVEVYLLEVRGFGGRGKGKPIHTSTFTPGEPYL